MTEIDGVIWVYGMVLGWIIGDLWLLRRTVKKLLCLVAKREKEESEK